MIIWISRKKCCNTSFHMHWNIVPMTFNSLKKDRSRKSKQNRNRREVRWILSVSFVLLLTINFNALSTKRQLIFLKTVPLIKKVSSSILLKGGALICNQNMNDI